jgi:hypothetical protein
MGPDRQQEYNGACRTGCSCGPNVRVLLGQIPPLKLREIWAIRIRLQSAAKLKSARSRAR